LHTLLTFERMHQQPATLYEQHVRHAESPDSWATADAMESSGDE